METNKILKIVFVIVLLGFLGVLAFIAYPFYQPILDKIIGKVAFNADPISVTDDVIEGNVDDQTGEVDNDEGGMISSIDAQNTLSIPTIGLVDVPVIYPENNDYETIEMALENGVVHLVETADPNVSKGRTIIVGHSSNFSWRAGDYNYVFQYLENLEPGNTIKLRYLRDEYVYTVVDKVKSVSYEDVQAMEYDPDKKILIVMTCWPPNTSRSRMAVVAEAGLK